MWFILQLAGGIYLIHGRVAWFVVSAGRNGAEFSTLLILSFIVVMMSAPAAYNLGRPR